MGTRGYPELIWLKSLALQAGGLIRAGFFNPTGFKLKSDGTPVTKTDEAVNELVLQSFADHFPWIDLISEEGSRRVHGAKFRAFCDPIDGTIPFAHGLPISTFCLSILVGHQPIAAVIHDPFTNSTWCAGKGEGLHSWHEIPFEGIRSGVSCQLSPCRTISGANAAILWWRNSPYRVHEICARFMAAGGSWINPASIAIFGGLIADGRYDASIFPGQHGWETAAMQLIVEEAGGKATDIYGRPLEYGPDGEIQGHIISNGQESLHSELVSLVQLR